MTSVRVSPTLARCEHSSTRPMNASPASRPPSQPNENTAPGPFGQVLLRQRVVRVVRQPGVAHPAHARVGVQPLRDRLRVGDVRVHPQRQRLHALQDQERVERREHAAEVAQPLDAQLGGEAVLAEVVPEAQVAVGGDRLGHHREVAVVPREPAGVDDRRRRSRCRGRRGTSSRSAGRCRRRGRAGGRGTGEASVESTASGTPAVVRDLRRAPRGRRSCPPGWRRSRCRASFVRPGLDRGGERGRVVGRDERRLDAEPAQRHVRAACRCRRRARWTRRCGRRRSHSCGEQQRLGRLPAAGRDGADPALQARDALLERGDGRVAEARVDVPVLLQREQVGRVRGVLEHERRRLVDRHGARAGGRIRSRAGVDRAGARAPVAVLRLGHRAAHAIAPAGYGPRA